MSIFTPSLGILHFDNIPVECVGCDYSETRSDLTDETKQAIIETTVYLELDKERLMLGRTRRLFSRHPKSRHPIVLKTTGRRNTETPCSDPDFENDLLSDPELHQFLTNGTFNLAGRESFVASRVSELIGFTTRDDVRCDQCGAYVVVPRPFYFEVGTFLDHSADN